MQRLDLDFAGRGRAHRWAGPLLLAIALGIAGDMAWSYVQLERSVKSAERQVALLAIEPDAKSGKVLISGDSKDYLAALSYVLNLSQSPSLADVQLVRHEVKKNDPQHAVSFQISAAWSASR